MSQARVTSVQAIADFRACLISFGAQVRDALTSVNLETRRTLEWILDRQPSFWEAEIRRWSDNVLEAKKDLHRCRSWPTPGGGVPSCLEEKKALDRAKIMLGRAEEKLVVTKRWGSTVQREVMEYDGRANQLAAWLDGTLPAAIAYLDRSLNAIDAYMSVHTPTTAATDSAETRSVARASPTEAVEEPSEETKNEK
ncbi:MAG: hypothetical protein AB7O62_01980 [Pirellulales bacterium]